MNTHSGGFHLVDTDDMAALILPVPSQPGTLGANVRSHHPVWVPRMSTQSYATKFLCPKVWASFWSLACAGHGVVCVLCVEGLVPIPGWILQNGTGFMWIWRVLGVLGVLWRKVEGVVALISQWKNTQHRLIAHVGCATCKTMCDPEHGVQRSLICSCCEHEASQSLLPTRVVLVGHLNT